MDTRQLQYIIAIAETGNLSAAADRLFITQSALSQQLAKLKKEGLPPLFREERRRMVLTDAGKIYLNGARTILRTESLAKAQMDLLSENKVLRFHFSIAPYLQSDIYLDVLPALRKQFSQAVIEVSSDTTEGTRNALSLGTIDMALIPDIYQQQDFYTYTQVLRDELVIVSGSQTININLPMVLPAEHSYLREMCNRIFSQLNQYPEIYAESNDISISLALVTQGICNTILPRSLLKKDSLTLVSFSEPYYFNLVCIYQKMAASPILDAAIKELKQYYQKN
jgi:DNA-binding transcriptional LysR family regulator